MTTASYVPEVRTCPQSVDSLRSPWLATLEQKIAFQELYVPKSTTTRSHHHHSPYHNDITKGKFFRASRIEASPRLKIVCGYS